MSGISLYSEQSMRESPKNMHLRRTISILLNQAKSTGKPVEYYTGDFYELSKGQIITLKKHNITFWMMKDGRSVTYTIDEQQNIQEVFK